MPLTAAELAELIDSQAASLKLWVASRCSDAEDVVQEAFCRLASLDPSPDKPVAWLYHVSRNLAENQRRTDRRRRQRETDRAPEERTVADPAEPLERSEMLVAVENLEGELREVLVARIWGQMSLEEIGKLCDISVATAHRRYRAALDALRSKLNSPCEQDR